MSTTATITVGESSTGMIHLAYAQRGYGTAACSTGGNIRSTIVRRVRTLDGGTRPEGKLCTKCFPTK